MTEYQIPMWRCPGCGKDFPCIKVADSLVPIVPLLVPTFEPVARMFGADNQPLARPLPELIATSQWRASLRVVPHELVCAALARTRGKTLPPLACSALPAPLPGAQPPNVDTETPQDGPQREVKAPGIDFQTEGNPTPAGGDAPDDPRGAQPTLEQILAWLHHNDTYLEDRFREDVAEGRFDGRSLDPDSWYL